MTRKIKFRAWDKIGKCWLQSRLIQDFLTIGVPEDPKDGIFTIHDYKTNRIEIMQFTGMRDQENIEIYEGDILGRLYRPMFEEPDGTMETAVVTYKDFEFIGDKGKGNGSGIKFFIENPQPYKVIGNIYENPELLEAKSANL